MNKQQTASLLKEGANEIQRLRQANSLLSARIDMFDKMVSLFEASPNRGNNGLMCPDIFYELSKAAEALASEAAPENMPTSLNIAKSNA